MQFVKSLIFNLFLYLAIIFILILALPSLVLPNRITLLFGKFLANIIIFLMRFILGTKVIFHGLENLNKNKNFFVASAHQSMFETFALQIPLDGPIFILKKELLSIPLFGWYLRKIGAIAIVRETTTKENLNFFDKVKERIGKSKRPLLIFPQGTRVKLNEQPPFKKGVGRIYNALNLPCIPVALNTGKVWPKNSFMKYPDNLRSKSITLKILPEIKPGLSKLDFLAKLEFIIEKNSDDLIKLEQ